MTIARVFVANRGEIAVRIVRAYRALGLEAVVGVSDVDRDSAAARLADRGLHRARARRRELPPAGDDRAGRARHRLRRDPSRRRVPVREPAAGAALARTVIPPHYDSLMAKLIGRGPDRATAVEVPSAGLDRLEVEGVQTNRALLRDVLSSDDFAAGAVTTRRLEEVAVA